MADKNDAREFMIKRGYVYHRELDCRIAYGEVADLLTAYAAAVTQERDALREFAQHKLGCWVRYKTTANWNGHNPACNCGLNEAMAAAEESQPK